MPYGGSVQFLSDLRHYKVYVKELQPIPYSSYPDPYQAGDNGSCVYGINQIGILNFGLVELESWSGSTVEYYGSTADEIYHADSVEFIFQ